MEEEEMLKMEREIYMRKRESDDKYKHIERLENIADLLKAPKGIFIKRCPLCGKRLVRQRFAHYVHCECGYEYADPSWWWR